MTVNSDVGSGSCTSIASVQIQKGKGKIIVELMSRRGHVGLLLATHPYKPDGVHCGVGPLLFSFFLVFTHEHFFSSFFDTTFTH